jgi:hypothetical protein
VGIDDEPAQVRFPHHILQPGMISALRQPEPGRIGVKHGPVGIAAGEDLRAHGFRRLLEQGKQSMRRGRRHDLETTFVAQPANDAEQVAVPLEKTVPAFQEMAVIKFREPAQLFVVVVADGLALRQRDRAIEIPHITLQEQLVLQHRAQRWRDRHGQLERHAVANQPLHHPEQREVAFGYRLEEPVFLEKLVMLRMPDERQVRVKDEREVTGRHAILKL